MNQLKAVLSRLDEIQRREPRLGFLLGVVKKFGTDNAGNLAALVSYYAFFSVFPLMLVLFTVLGFVLRGNPRLQDSIVHSALAKIPIIGSQIQQNVHSIKGSGLGLVVGIVFTLLAGIGVISALQFGMDEVWAVPYSQRSNFLISRVRAIVMLAVLGVGTLAATGVSGLGSYSGAGSFSFALQFLGPLASLALNFLVLLLAFKLLTVAPIAWRQMVPGALVGGVAVTALQRLGTLFITHELKGATQTYGTFATVIALLAFLYLGSQIILYCAEINVVKARRLWPRALTGDPTWADQEAFTYRARMQQQVQDEVIDVTFPRPPSDTWREEPAPTAPIPPAEAPSPVEAAPQLVPSREEVAESPASQPEQGGPRLGGPIRQRQVPRSAG